MQTDPPPILGLSRATGNFIVLIASKTASILSILNYLREKSIYIFMAQLSHNHLTLFVMGGGMGGVESTQRVLIFSGTCWKNDLFFWNHVNFPKIYLWNFSKKFFENFGHMTDYDVIRHMT